MKNILLKIRYWSFMIVFFIPTIIIYLVMFLYYSSQWIWCIMDESFWEVETAKKTK